MAHKVFHPNSYIWNEASHLSTNMSAFPKTSHRLTTEVIALAALYTFDLAPLCRLVLV
jgi:hypothetical protein